MTDVWPAAEDVVGVPLVRGLGGGCQPVEQVDDSGMVFVRMCPGTFTMGSPEDEEGRYSDEGPDHQVTLSEFSIGKYEVTNQQYRTLVPDHQGDDDLPATYVNWHEAKAFCEQFGFRLPTEAEWEYAARAGTQSRWSFGDDESQLERYGWYSKNSGTRAHPVGTREPNEWGLHDMHGNVYEWVSDRWANVYPAEPQVDPTGPATGDRRVVRGGSFWVEPGGLRSAFRRWDDPEGRFEDVGFRCVRSPLTP
ncbi:MAG: formylglycine-generating enzyme family protein [Actinomycetia bacterium]|nr:formylglycine-generating enzyme family protein [Actinomycetes bacterium]